MTREQLIKRLQETNAADLEVCGEHPRHNSIRLETLDTQAAMRIYYQAKAIGRKTGLKVVCGEMNNGTGRFFVRVSGLE